MKLSIVYNISNFSNTLIRSIKSLSNINSNNFETIFIFNTNDNSIIEYINSKISFNKNAKNSFVFINQNLGHSYGYNVGQKLAIGEYVYFAGSKNIFKENFVDEIELFTKNKVYDLILLFDEEAIKFTEENYIKNDNTDSMNIKRKIINRRFIKKNKLIFTNYKYYNILYLFELNEKAKKIGKINKVICDFVTNEKVHYNLYDILSSSEILFNKILDSNFSEDKKDYYYMVITIYILYEFIYKIFKNYDDKNVIQNSIFNAYLLIEKIYPDFKSNKFFKENSNKKIPEYILNFKPNIKYCKKIMDI